ncbi:transcriptional regulator, ArsR family [Actinoplanes sp. N902-109]|nr:transcriptional regulator, ArsR family [Actinoplanes sp. N902-109]
MIVAALDHPQRLAVVAALAPGRQYVSALARQLGISRPLLYLHLERLERAGLVAGSLELGADGKAMKFYELRPFDLHLTPAAVVAAHEATRAAADSEAARAPQEEQRDE